MIIDFSIVMDSISSLLAKAQQLCEQRGVRMTSHRMLIYRLLVEHKNAISAYDLLEKLKKTEPQAKPPTIYRALDFFIDQGLAHKIESTSCFIPCLHIDNKNYCSQLLVCEQCGGVTECHNQDAVALLTQKSVELGFSMTHHIIETHGLCHSCQQ